MWKWKWYKQNLWNSYYFCSVGLLMKFLIMPSFGIIHYILKHTDGAMSECQVGSEIKYTDRTMSKGQMGYVENGRWGQRLNILMWQCHIMEGGLYFGKGDNKNVLYRRCTYFHFPSISFINSFKTSSYRWSRPEVMTSVIVQIGNKKKRY